LLVSACTTSERSFCSGDQHCLDCEACVEGLCVLDESRLNACGECGPAPEEICDDSQDNDCDGHTDEECSELCEGVTCDQPPGPCHDDEGICSNGVCTYQRKPEGTACDDGDTCTTADECYRGACQGTPATCDTPPPNECTDAYTMRSYAAEGSCTAGSCNYGHQDVNCQSGCADGACVGDPCAGVVCDQPPGPCYEAAGVCSKGSCSYPPISDGTACDDGQSCTVDDACQNGVCSGTAMTCNTPPPSECLDQNTMRSYETEGFCRDGACSYNFQDSNCAHGCENGRCMGDPCAGVACDNPPNQCYLVPGTCTDGVCNYSYANGSACSDGDACTVGDTCQNGTCSGTAVVCNNPPNQCYHAQGSCSGGECSYDYNNGAGCDDGDACTVGDTCQSGTCSGTLLTCDSPPPDECINSDTRRTYQAGSCDQGSCVYPHFDVFCANGCLNGLCQGCTPDCSGRDCGPDPVCGEDCGPCAAGEICDSAGLCIPAGCVLDVYEPDNDSTNAKLLQLDSAQTHTICPVGDQDWIMFVVVVFTRVTLETSGSADDTRMWLYDAQLTELEYDDDGGANYFSLIEIDLAPGQYFIKIDEYGGNDEIESYQLSATACLPDCSSVECGPDPVCGATCNSCQPGQICAPQGICTDGREEDWSYPTGGYVLSSPAIAADGTVYVGSHDYKLYAFNPSGTVNWSYSSGGAIYTSPALGSDGTVYFGSDDYKVHAVNPDGTFKWDFETGDVIDSSPAIGADGTIYIGSKDNKLYAINPDGTLKWSYTTGGDVDSAPSISEDGTVYVGSDDDKLYALSQNGDLLWTYTTGDDVHASPAIGSDGTIYVGSHDGKLYALNPDGTMKWSFTTADIVRASAAIAADGTIYAGSVDGSFYAVKPDGTLRWSFATSDEIRSSAAIGDDGTVYFGSYEGRLYALNPDGSLRWVCDGMTDSVFSRNLRRRPAGRLSLAQVPRRRAELRAPVAYLTPSNSLGHDGARWPSSVPSASPI
jgi:outer membrane protein assembly factor BamB